MTDTSDVCLRHHSKAQITCKVVVATYVLDVHGECRRMSGYEIVKTVDGDWMVLVGGIQWGKGPRDKSGASSQTWPSKRAAREAIEEDRKQVVEGFPLAQRRRTLPPGQCPSCDQWRGQAMFPSHDASHRCESGKHPHCTCDVCF